MSTDMRMAKIMGCLLHEVDMDTSLDLIEDMIRGDKFNLVVTLSTEMVMKSRKLPEFKQILESAELIVPDTIGILWAGKKAGLDLRERVTGIDLSYNLLDKALKKGWRVFFLGGKPGIARKAADNIKKDFPGLEISGFHHGYFTSGPEEEELINKIRESKTDIILCGMGSPLQEKWCKTNGPKTGAKVAVGIGGSLDVMAGDLKRAPGWMIKCNLEWLYRLLQQPSRLKRMTVLPVFILKIILSQDSLKIIDEGGSDR
ncbi:MAG: WecB/TagA/CpsF family glycosyltransferase [Candidatus Eremiobacteraeota bacterium]|nr:WecB/TagA/CpsF family glycosyltransferase [Candidatus Eremiobacteraeota bacterium]